ncbi:glutaminase domain-containing protein [Lacticaseibacillus absianus]|uniref:glutaminase domain-containing protein n=1 Tax=Lacticaseibacillus absianus TaxID=2729623 RepID=UPI0015CDD6C4|nr:DUF4965 domain-containing protein [Lacticaseibacillus absianus]
MERVPSVPLFVQDPYFSVWSPADKLTDVTTESWTGKQMPVEMTLTLDGKPYNVMGWQPTLEALPQVDLQIEPTRTLAVFQTGEIELTLTFAQHFDLHDIETISEPVTYVAATLISRDGVTHHAQLTARFDGHITYEDLSGDRLIAKSFVQPTCTAAMMGKARQTPLNGSGDQIDIDWGYLYLCGDPRQGAKVGSYATWNHQGLQVTLTLDTDATLTRYFLVAYDDVHAIEYFGTVQNAYWTHRQPSMLALLAARCPAVAELIADCVRIDAQIDADARAVGGDDYRLICATAYRQAIAAHKLIQDEQGQLVFLSKECQSNGCIGTVDVSYPSIPLFLLYAPELVEAMIRPVLRFAAMPVWTADYAPHDVGRYPYAVGQVYGMHNHYPQDDGALFFLHNDTIPQLYTWPASEHVYNHRDQMPIEECGNMLIMAGLVETALHDGFLATNLPQLKAWADYLVAYGEDPDEQLCTDDFAGHLAHNVNLALKAVASLGVFGQALQSIDPAAAEKYSTAAKTLAVHWQQAAASETDTRLTFDRDEGWSLKYNLIWDRVAGLGLFAPEVGQRELARYTRELNRYGAPLDSRATYTKADWLMWVAAMSDTAEQFAPLAQALVRYLHESPSRVPFSDWYDTENGRSVSFKHRSVIGGVFMPMLNARTRQQEG